MDVPQPSRIKLRRYQKLLDRLSVLPVDPPIDVLVLGDSLANGWTDRSLRKTFPGKNVVKAAIHGFKSKSTLWKLRTGDLDRLKPKMVVLCVGTNELPSASAGLIFRRIKATIEECLARWNPLAIFVIGIPPRGEDGAYKSRRRLAVNAKLAVAIKTMPRTHFVEVDSLLLGLRAAYLQDQFHFSPRGYDVVSTALRLSYVEHQLASSRRRNLRLQAQVDQQRTEPSAQPMETRAQPQPAAPAPWYARLLRPLAS